MALYSLMARDEFDASCQTLPSLLIANDYQRLHLTQICIADSQSPADFVAHFNVVGEVHHGFFALLEQASDPKSCYNLKKNELSYFFHFQERKLLLLMV